MHGPWAQESPKCLAMTAVNILRPDFWSLLNPELILGSVFQGHPSYRLSWFFWDQFILRFSYLLWVMTQPWYMTQPIVYHCIWIISGFASIYVRGSPLNLAHHLAHCDSAAIIIPGLSSGPWTMYHSEDFLHVHLQSNSGAEPLIGTIIQKSPKNIQGPFGNTCHWTFPSPILIVTWSSAVLNTAPIPLSLQHHQLKPDFADGFNGLQPHHSFLY